jgi:hypothetical protein
MLGFDTPQWMSGVVPDAKIIIILRHPVDRFYSECALPLAARRLPAPMVRLFVALLTDTR